MALHIACVPISYSEVAITLGFSISERLAWLIAFIAILWFIVKVRKHE
jgi:hypothetical protein